MTRHPFRVAPTPTAFGRNPVNLDILLGFPETACIAIFIRMMNTAYIELRTSYELQLFQRGEVRIIVTSLGDGYMKKRDRPSNRVLNAKHHVDYVSAILGLDQMHVFRAPVAEVITELDATGHSIPICAKTEKISCL